MPEVAKSNFVQVDWSSFRPIEHDMIMAEAIKSFTTKEEIEALEIELLNANNNIKIPVIHAFWKGGYARTITIPAGSLAIGHEHTDECLNIVVKGSVSVVIDGEVRVVAAPATFVSPPGQRKIGYVHEDLTWVTVHTTSTSDVDRVEEELIVKSDGFKAHEASTSLAACKVDEFTEDRMDYSRVLAEAGLTQDQVDKIVKSTLDQINYPCDMVEVRSSKIHGNGIFSKFPVSHGDIIGLALVNGKRTIIGRYTNHSPYPNARMECDNLGDISLKSLGKIMQGEEVVVDYRNSMEAARTAKSIIQKCQQ
jgi:hypothetical protein